MNTGPDKVRDNRIRRVRRDITRNEREFARERSLLGFLSAVEVTLGAIVVGGLLLLGESLSR